jgi:16S rRNA (adenine1518-N6/adenine1519-N6)-dimethyltransferase
VTHSSLASPLATRAVLATHGLATKKSLGQHFLIDDNVVGRILGLADLDGSESVLEIGPGIGTLTVALCDHAAHVVAVERDEELLPALQETTEFCTNLRVVHDDAVRVDTSELETPAGPAVALVANLPYAVAATVVLRFFQEIPSLRTAVVMVQAEVAARMAADPGNKDYGAYTVKLHLLAEPRGQFSVSRSCFMPPPRVDSTVIRLDRVTSVDPETATAAARTADAAFAQRRKTIRNSTKSVLGMTGEKLDVALQGAGIDGGRRAETLSVAEFVNLGSKMLEYGLLP